MIRDSIEKWWLLLRLVWVEKQEYQNIGVTFDKIAYIMNVQYETVLNKVQSNLRRCNIQTNEYDLQAKMSYPFNHMVYPFNHLHWNRPFEGIQPHIY